MPSTSRLERMVIKSPITGDVYQLAVHTVGGVIGPGEPLMLIVPEADELILQAQVMPQDIDKVRPGQIAHIRFPAFNSRLTPEVAAEVTQISADTSRTDASSPPFYSVRLMISATGACQARLQQAEARHAGGSLYPDGSAVADDLFPETTHRPVRSRVTRRLSLRFLLKPAPATEF